MILRYTTFYGKSPSRAHYYNGVTTYASSAAAQMNFSGAGTMVVTSLAQGEGDMTLSGRAVMVMGLRAHGEGDITFSGIAVAWFVPPYCVTVSSPPRCLVAASGRPAYRTTVGTPGRCQATVAGRARPQVTVKSGKGPC